MLWVSGVRFQVSEDRDQMTRLRRRPRPCINQEMHPFKIPNLHSEIRNRDTFYLLPLRLSWAF